MRFSRVDLPLPDGPITAVNSPSWTVSETPFNAPVTPPWYTFVMSLNCTSSLIPTPQRCPFLKARLSI